MNQKFSEKEYQKLLQGIFQRFPTVQQAGFSGNAYKPGLERIQAFDKALGYPSRAFRSIHVAGTNGKGSVCALLASALSSCGYKVGLFTSPHLVDFRERMMVAGDSTKDFGAESLMVSGPEVQGPGNVASRPCTGKCFPDPVPPEQTHMVPREYVFQFLTQWQPFFEEQSLSFFEITTGMAFKWFADCGVDVAVVETGLGGRLDSTNILVPDLSVVTTIGLDHCAQLGNTLPEIAAEKAGIFKKGVPALVGERQEETAPVFERKALETGSRLTFASEEKPALWRRRKGILRRMDLQARVQERNLRTVLTAVDILKEAPGFQKLNNTEALVEGLVHAARNMQFHGRWERLQEKPCVLADIGHNAHALQHNFGQLEALLQEGQFTSLIIVYGIMADKDLDAILPLMPREATYLFTTPATPRALPAADILQRFTAFRGSSARAFLTGSVREAVERALRLAGEQESALIYIGGSTFVVAEAVPLFP